MALVDPGARESGTSKIQAIQGLRGFAVLLVVLNHLEVPLFSNGFVGVDVFFVISGYLITKIMVKEYVSNRKASRRQGWISFIGFYSRRARRILPASYFIILIILIVGNLIPRLTNQASNLANEATWAALFLSNLHYADQATQYFGDAAQQSPYLHFWSLAVEEQFYIFWPIFFLMVTSQKGFKFAGIVFNWRNRLRLAMAIVIAISFSAYILLLTQESSAGYFSSITRFWEFGIGALFSLGVKFKVSRRVKYLLVLAVGLLIAAFSALSTNEFRFTIIFYVLLTGFLLHLSDSHDLPLLLRRILENRFLCFLGKISFSLYLVHWPMIVMSKNLGYETTGYGTLILFPAMIFLSWFVYKEVEERFLKINIPIVSKRSAARRTRYFPLNTDALKYSTLVVVVLITFVNVEAGNGKPLATKLFQAKVAEPWIPPTKTVDTEGKDGVKIPPTLIPNENSLNDLWNKEIIEGLQFRFIPQGIQPSLSQLDADRLSRWNDCLSILSNFEVCNSGSEFAERKVYILGDSYALSLTPMIQRALSGLDYQVVARNRGQCLVPDATPLRNNLEDDDCDFHRQKVNEEIARVQPEIIIASSWNAQSVVGGDASLLAGMEKQLQFLKKNTKNLIVISETPAIPDPRKCFDSNKEIANCIGKATASNRYRLLTEQIAKKVGISYLDLTPWMCFSNSCPPIIDNNFVTWDGGHLTTSFSAKLSPLFLAYLTRIGALE
jgi:peptidoglycan/LPS O-acetylase OafA/YrhL